MSNVSQLPKRNCLSDQAAEILRRGITEGRWKSELPSENQLCREFQVSRVTLRRSLEQLFREKLVLAGGRGKRHRITGRPSVGKTSPQGTIVRILTPYSTMVMGATHHSLLEAFGDRLSSEGYHYQVEHHRGLFDRHEPERLARLDSLPDTAGWVLFFSTREIQQWFAERRRPCIVFGRTDEDVNLDCIYHDTAATARHAAGLLHARGHRELAYLTPEFTSIGDRFGASAFAAEAGRLGMNVQIITHAPTTPSLRKTLAKLLGNEPRPTGFFSGYAQHSITLLCHLLNSGIHVPEKASILTGWDDPFLHHTSPVISSYRINGTKVGHRMAMLMLGLLGGAGTIQKVPIIPDFLAGESLGPAPHAIPH